jgi:hypothetical protein
MLSAGASMVAAINSVVGGVSLALLAAKVVSLARAPRWRSAPLPPWSCSGCTCYSSSTNPPTEASSA